MNMDFHVHGILSKKLNFDEELFIQGINFAKNSGLHGLVLCEHFNAIDIDSSFHFLKIILFMKTTDMMLMDFMYI